MLNMELARKYARAIFELANENGWLAQCGKELADVQQGFAACPELKAYLGNPNIQPKEKKVLLAQLFVGEISKTTLHFLLLLIDKRRIQTFDAIAHIFAELSNEARGIVVADVTTAQPLAEAQEKALREKLERVTGKKIDLRGHRDPSLIGGVVVRIGDRRIDGSVKGRLAAMTAELMAN